MSLHVEPMTSDGPLDGRAVFLSASIPDPQRWSGAFDAREITDAVVAAGRAVLTAGGVLVTAAHPSVAPLLLYVAGEFPPDPDGLPKVITYQSALFENVMPEATLRFAEAGIGDFRVTPAVEGDEPEPGAWDESLRLMRETMFSETEPVAGIFIGGMEGIQTEFDLLNQAPRVIRLYPVGHPGGAAAGLEIDHAGELGELLAMGDVYPTIFRQVVIDLAEGLEPS